MRILLVAAVALTSLARVWAGPLDTAELPPGAAWLVHVDVDAVRNGPIPMAVSRLGVESPISEDDLGQLAKVVGMDPTKDIHSVTIFGRRYTPADGVVILRAEADRERLTTLLRNQPGFRSESYAKHELMIWIDNEGQDDEQTSTGCFYQPGLMVFGHDGDLVRKTIDVIDGRAESLPDTAPVLSWEVPAGAIIEVRATGLAGASQFKSPVVLQTKSLGLACGERDGELFATARLVTETKEVAEQVQAVVGGFFALAQLQYGSDQDATKLFRAVKVTMDNQTVEVAYRGSIEDVGVVLKKLLATQSEVDQD